MAKKKAAKLDGILKVFGKFRNVTGLEKLPNELRGLIERWNVLPKHVREGILILARVKPISSARSKANATVWHTSRGADPEWQTMALNILKDASGFLTDREIARRVGVSPSTLCRNEAYKKAKQTYLQPFQTSGRRGLHEKDDE